MYRPTPVPQSLPPDARRYLEEELERIAYLINELLKYNEDNP